MAVSQAIAQRNAKNAPRKLLKGVSVLADLADGGAVYGYPGDYAGKIYFVNNITGDDEFDGLSWATPFDQVSTAITASEAHRRTFSDWAPRSIIYIQGTGTVYDNLTVLPNHCDMIGIGADPRGDGFGIVVIEGVGVDAAAGSCVGLYMTNIQFAVSGGTSYSAFDVIAMIQSTIENCTFMGSTASTAVNNAAFRSTGNFAGSTIRNCVFGTTNGTEGFNHGLEHSAGVGNNNYFENNVFFGKVYGVEVTETINDNGAVWKSNLMHSFLGTVEPTAAGFRMGTDGHAVANYICGVDAIEGADASQTIYNYTIAGTTPALEDAF